MKDKNKRFLHDRLPILKWAPSYNTQQLQADIIAGFTVGLTVIPQSLAYAALAGLPVQYGLYSSFMGSFFYTILGTSKDITLGPTAIMALLISEYCNNKYGDSTTRIPSDPGSANLLALLTAVILMLMAVFKVGFLVNFIPHCVIVGFTCAAAIIISSSQIKNLLGLCKLASDDPNYCTIPKPFFQQWIAIVKNIFTARWQDIALSVVCLIILKGLQIAKQEYGDKKPGSKPDSTLKHILRKTLWFSATARNAIVVIASTILAFSLAGTQIENENGVLVCPDSSFTLTGALKGGLPPFKLPDLTRQVPQPDVTTGQNMTCFPDCGSAHHPYTPPRVECDVSNITKRSVDDYDTGCVANYEHPYYAKFGELVGNLGSGLVVIPVMAYLESIAIAKGFSKKFGYKVDSTQELYAISICNLFTSFVGGFPVTGSFGRSAVNAASNVATPAGGIITGLMVLLSTAFLVDIFFFIPKASLSAVIFLAAISMFDWDGVKHVYKLRKLDILPLVITFLLCFYWTSIKIFVKKF